MEQIVSCVLSLAVGVLGFIIRNLITENRRLRDIRKEKNMTIQEAMANGIKYLLMIKLIEYHDRYYPTGKISTHAYSNFMKMYKAYNALGGNGLVTKMKEEIETLEVE